MVPILPVDFAVKPKANNSKSQEFSMWETVIFLLLKAAVLPCWEQRQRCLGTCPVKHWRKMTQSILKTCVLSLQLSFNVPFDKLSRRKVSRLCFYGQPCHATRQEQTPDWESWGAEREVGTQLVSVWLQGQKANAGGGDSPVQGAGVGLTEIFNSGRKELQNSQKSH